MYRIFASGNGRRIETSADTKAETLCKLSGLVLGAISVLGYRGQTASAAHDALLGEIEADFAHSLARHGVITASVGAYTFDVARVH